MSIDLPRTRHGFILARDARAAGREAELEVEVRSNRLEVVRRGVYATPELEPEKQSAARRAAIAYRRQVLAASETLRSPVFTSFSAIALHRLPIIHAWPAEVFVLAPGSHGFRRRTTIGVARLDDVPVTLVDGVEVAALEHSLVQLCRHATLGAALVAVEAAVAMMPWKHDPPLTTIELIRAEHERLLPYPGSRKTDAVLRRATSLSGSPLETCSKLVFEEFGFPQPVQQQAFWLPEHRCHAYADFTWPEQRVVGEADGDTKYLAVASATDAAEAVIDEKLREEALRRQVDALDRWGWSAMWAREPLVRRLIELGLPGGTRRFRLF